MWVCIYLSFVVRFFFLFEDLGQPGRLRGSCCLFPLFFSIAVSVALANCLNICHRYIETEALHFIYVIIITAVEVWGHTVLHFVLVLMLEPVVLAAVLWAESRRAQSVTTSGLSGWLSCTESHSHVVGVGLENKIVTGPRLFKHIHSVWTVHFFF